MKGIYCCLLTLLSVSHASRIVAETGENAILNCSYDISYYGPLTSCWTRGELPGRGLCGSNPIISTDGKTVTEVLGVSGKYQLTGRLDRGDVSLTIVNVTAEDEGTYGCRVDVPGWFNDKKHHFNLEIRNAAEPSSSESPDTNTEDIHPTDHMTRGDHMTSTVGLLTSSSGIEAEDKTSRTVVLLSVLFTVLTVLTVAVVLIIVRKWSLFKKMPESLVPVRFNSTASNLQLQHRNSAIDNIYNIEPETDYERCP